MDGGGSRQSSVCVSLLGMYMLFPTRTHTHTNDLLTPLSFILSLFTTAWHPRTARVGSEALNGCCAGSPPGRGGVLEMWGGQGQIIDGLNSISVMVVLVVESFSS